jgi:hypothetical protein
VGGGLSLSKHLDCPVHYAVKRAIRIETNRVSCNQSSSLKMSCQFMEHLEDTKLEAIIFLAQGSHRLLEKTKDSHCKQEFVEVVAE